MNRISKSGKMVMFAFEQTKIPEFWLTDYFPYFIRDTLATFPSTEKIAQAIAEISKKEVQIATYFLPSDLSDLFAASGWCKPKLYLDKEVRSGISSFSKMPKKELEAGLNRLRADLNDGSWKKKYGSIEMQNEYDAGYRILFTK